ncbi:MAG: alpha/beta hydrolase-fold protein [Pirellulaceae bacterium]|nr:prolyl oligopeptidase family serine peptidase [Planctomycetales bacterium]
MTRKWLCNLVQPRIWQLCVFWVAILSELSEVAAQQPQSADKLPSIARILPPVGEHPPIDVANCLQEGVRLIRTQLDTFPPDRDGRADVAIFVKAIDFALRHDEFYRDSSAAIADELLAVARQRVTELQRGEMPWAQQRGLVVRGYHSSIDGSPQPYGLVIPKSLDLRRPVPLYVWLHGRGDRDTDMYFIQQRMTKAGEVAPDDAIVVHPFGRHCVGFKHAGEIDVLDVIADVQRQYPIDPLRIVLMGFSMGGAGAWHIGAHYTDRFAAIAPGAGFAETAHYNRLKPEDFPPRYEQLLWGAYDVPNYVGNLLNVPVVAYSGENDKQIQAARVMEEAFRSRQRTLNHVIGPGMGHKYHPESLTHILAAVRVAAANPPQFKPQLSLQTRTLRYHRMQWLELLRLKQHWHDSRVDAVVDESNRIVRLATANALAIRAHATPLNGNVRDWQWRIDGQEVPVQPGSNEEDSLTFAWQEGRWRQLAELADDGANDASLVKRPGLQGPIDDAFMQPFLMVLPSTKSSYEVIQRWIESESQHAVDRWRALMRGEPRVKLDTEVTPEDIEQFNLVLWGEPSTNRLLAKIHKRLPLNWQANELSLAGKTWDAATHLPMMVYPNPLNRRHYVVINSGLTFREGHDRTNSQQNPKLPDWAILDLTSPPDELSPGNVVMADFFDEHWQAD